MSVTTSKLTKTTKKVSTKTKQQFIRLNLDPALEKMLQEYEQKYTLLSRSDIIRMLLSEIYWEQKEEVRSKNGKIGDIFDRLKVTNPVLYDLSEDQMFEEWQKFKKNF
jgi:hypothetical protein